MNCPPEDFLGVRGYSNILEILKQPDREKYESFIERLGGVFDLEHVNQDEVNEMLKTKDCGCKELDD